MGNNLRAHSKDPGFQATYKLSQYEKANEELVKTNKELVSRINDELLPTVKGLQEDNEMLGRLSILSLFELGGSITVSKESFNNAESKIVTSVDTENNELTFALDDDVNDTLFDKEAIS